MSFYNFWPQPVFPENTQTGAIAGSSASLNVIVGRMYRLVANTDWFMKCTKGAGAATTSDIFVPAGQVQVLIANGFDTISFIQSSAGGKLSVTEVQNLI